jgi:Flp pilus assembly protein protease CpaA
MPSATFFPDVVFAWTFYLTLAAVTLIAAYIDWRKLIVPKPLVLVTLVSGLAANAWRGALLAQQGKAVAYLDPGGVAWGAIDGVLFSLAGFAVGFSLFFILWLLGTCGGGDVKWFAALGAWLGPLWTIYLLIGTWFVVMFGFVLLGWLVHVVRHGRRPRRQQVAYSFPVALTMIALLAWFCRVELELVVPKPQGQQAARVLEH